MSDSVIEKLFPPKSFSNSPISTILLSQERKVICLPRTDKNKEKIYNNFDEIFKTFLLKMSDTPAKKYTSNLFQKGLIYIGSSMIGVKKDVLFTRVYMLDNSLSGVGLDSGLLGINLDNGETSNIDNCVYAAYNGFIRSSILSQSNDIKSNVDLHKLLTSYIYNILLRVSGKTTVYTDKQKLLLHLASIYIYYKHFFNEKHQMILGYIRRDYKQFFKSEFFDELLPALDSIQKYESMQDIPKILLELKLFHDAPGNITIKLLHDFGNTGFYAFIGPLDHFIPMVILCKYPTELFPRTAMSIEKLHDAVEQLMIPYFDKLTYKPTKVLG